MDTSSNSIENQLTLTFLSNPLYHVNLKKHEKIGPDKQELKFYRKRILSLHKDMLRGIMPNKNIKNIHDNYVNCLINYFKMVDKKDILQEEYNELQFDMSNNSSYNENSIKDANTVLMDHIEKQPTLDKFVKKIKYIQEPLPPRQKKLNLKTENLKTKGVKTKKSKKENVT